MTWSRRDQIQAYQFLRRRSTSALVLADPNDPQSPTRRPLFAAVTGLIVLALVLGGFGVYGALRPGGNKNWRTPGAIVMQKDSGTRFVLGQDNLLHPVLNYSSARLVVGKPDAQVVSLTANSLRAAPRGKPIGIPDAPDALPGPKDLLSGGWTTCARPGGVGGTPRTAVLLGPPPMLRDAPGTGLLVRDSANRQFLLAEGRRYAVRGAQARQVLNALGFTGATPLPVPDAWLDTVPAGSDLVLPNVRGRGDRPRWPAPPEARVGDVLRISNVAGAVSFYLVESAGVRTLTEVEAALAVAVEGKAALNFTVLPNATEVPPPTVPPVYPKKLPKMAVVVRPDEIAVCALVPPGGSDTVTLSVVADIDLARRSPLTVTAPAGQRREVGVPSGAGALVQAGGPGGALYLVTDQGTRFAVPDKDARDALGYASVTPVTMPAPLVSLLPAGPTLSRTAAAQVVGG